MPEVINPTIITPEPTPNTAGLAKLLQPTIQNIYSTSNVSEAMTTPRLKPDLNDPLGMKATIEQNLGLNSLRTAERSLSSQLTSLRDTGRQQQLAIKNLPQALNVIRGEQAVARETQALSEQALAEQVGVAQTARLAAEQQAMEQFNILNTERTNKLSLATQYPGAKISVYDDYSSITKKIAKYNEQQAKDAYKSELKSSAMKLGLNTKGSTKELEKRIAKEYEGQALIQKAKDKLSLQTAKPKDTTKKLKATLAEKVYAGELSREQAKALFEIESGTTWDIYKDIPDGYEVKRTGKTANVVTAPDGTLVEIVD